MGAPSDINLCLTPPMCAGPKALFTDGCLSPPVPLLSTWVSKCSRAWHKQVQTPGFPLPHAKFLQRGWKLQKRWLIPFRPSQTHRLPFRHLIQRLHVHPRLLEYDIASHFTFRASKKPTSEEFTTWPVLLTPCSSLLSNSLLSLSSDLSV